MTALLTLLVVTGVFLEELLSPRKDWVVIASLGLACLIQVLGLALGWGDWHYLFVLPCLVPWFRRLLEKIKG